MLSPRKPKYRKVHKQRLPRITDQLLSPNTFALKSSACGRVTSRQIEAARRVIRRKLERTGKLEIGIFPDKPVTSKPTEVRMGKGKGSVDFWCALVPEGRIVFQLSRVSKNAAMGAFSLGSSKLPIPTKFVYFS